MLSIWFIVYLHLLDLEDQFHHSDIKISDLEDQLNILFALSRHVMTLDKIVDCTFA